MSRALKIISLAIGHIGKFEKPGNAGFLDAAFEKDMKAVGWYVKAPWCAFLVRLIWQYAYADHKGLMMTIKLTFTGGALDTFKRVQTAETLATGLVPRPGAVVIWSLGKGPSGHAGIVLAIFGNTMITIEGNTNASGSSEGNQVAIKLRTISREFKADGLNVKGYIYPFEI